jgi:hypothetical protein
MSNGPRQPSLLEAIMGVVAPIRRPEPRVARREAPTPAPTSSEPGAPEIVDRRDQTNPKYRGDFPNPTGGSYKGCF